MVGGLQIILLIYWVYSKMWRTNTLEKCNLASAKEREGLILILRIQAEQKLAVWHQNNITMKSEIAPKAKLLHLKIVVILRTIMSLKLSQFCFYKSVIKLSCGLNAII